MSREAELIDEARRLFREALGSPREDAAYAYLMATVAEVKRTTHHPSSRTEIVITEDGR